MNFVVSAFFFAGHSRAGLIHRRLSIFCSRYWITRRLCLERFVKRNFPISISSHKIFLPFKGLWVLLDLKLYPESLSSSAWASLVSKIDLTLQLKSRKFLSKNISNSIFALFTRE